MMNMDWHLSPTVPCKLCENLTFMLGTKLCDPCWELQRRIEDNPALARKILEMIELEKSNKEKSGDS